MNCARQARVALCVMALLAAEQTVLAAGLFLGGAGCPGVAKISAPLPGPLERELGMSTSQLTARVQKKLDEGHLRKPALDAAGGPVLELRVGHNAWCNVNSYSVSLHFLEAVQVQRAPNRAFLAKTWESGGSFGGCPAIEADKILARIDEMLNHFVEACSAAPPE